MRTCVHVCPGEGARTPGRVPVETLLTSPLWREVEDAVGRVAHVALSDLLQRTTLCDHLAPLSPVATVATSILFSALWRSHGHAPDVVVGHSIGEVAALQIAGILGVHDAIRLAAGLGMLGATQRGAMAHAWLEDEEVETLLSSDVVSSSFSDHSVRVAAINGVAEGGSGDACAKWSVTVSGDASDVKEWAATSCETWRAAVLTPPHPWHHPSYDAFFGPFFDAFFDALFDASAVRPRVPSCTLVSCTFSGAREMPLCGRRTRQREFSLVSGDHWRTWATQPVRFDVAMRTMADELLSRTNASSGECYVVDVGAQPVLLRTVLSTLASLGVSVTSTSDSASSNDDVDCTQAWSRRVSQLGTSLREAEHLEGEGSTHPTLSSDSIRSALRDALHSLVGSRAEDADAWTTPWTQLGVRSADVLSTARRLGAALETDIPPIALFQHATPDALARHLQAENALPCSGATQTPFRPRAKPPAKSSPVVCGSSMRLPGKATSQALWSSVLDASCDAVASRLPTMRWTSSSSSVEAEACVMLPAGLAARVQCFDATAFSVSRGEAQDMDPQQRILLESTYATLAECTGAPEGLRACASGFVRTTVNEADIAVAIGLMHADFAWLAKGEGGVYEATGSQPSVASGRVSFALGLQGACETYDTACSSSLVALHAAAVRPDMCLQDEEQTFPSAVVACANLLLCPRSTCLFRRAGMLSKGLLGRCRTMDAHADGYVRSEAVVSAALMLASAPACDHARRMRIPSTAVGSDGRSASLTAPNGSAQHNLLRRVHAGSPRRTCDASEAHGTGTALGDPIEAAALLRAHMDVYGVCTHPLHGVKSQVGHAEASAGMVGAVCAVRCTYEQAASTTLALLRVVNAHVDGTFRAEARGGTLLLPLHRVRLQTTPSSSGTSSFGYSGTIAHVLTHSGALVANAVRSSQYDTGLFRRTRFTIPWSGGTSPSSRDVRAPANTTRPRAHAAVSAARVVRTAGVAVDSGIGGATNEVYLGGTRCDGDDVSGALAKIPSRGCFLVHLRQRDDAGCDTLVGADASVDAIFTRAIEVGSAVVVACSGALRGSAVRDLLRRACVVVADSTFSCSNEDQDSTSAGRITPRHASTPRVMREEWCDVRCDGDGDDAIRRARSIVATLARTARDAPLKQLMSTLPAASIDAALVCMGSLMSRGSGATTRNPRVRLFCSVTETCIVELNDAARANTFSREMAEDVAAAVCRAREFAPRSVALVAAGAHFCAGGSPYGYGMAEAEGSVPLAAMAHACLNLFDGFLSLLSMRVPLVGAVQGTIIGGGMAICMNVDHIVAHAATATFCHGNVVRGVCPLGMFSRTLAHRIGACRARWMYLSNETVDAQGAVRMGLVHELSPGADVEPARERARRLALSLASESGRAARACAFLVNARARVDPALAVTEAVMHARCLISNGGGYAKPQYASSRCPDASWTSECECPVPAEPDRYDEAAVGTVDHVTHAVEVPRLLTQDALDALSSRLKCIATCARARLVVFQSRAEGEGDFCVGADVSATRLSNGAFLHDIERYATVAEAVAGLCFTSSRPSCSVCICSGATRGGGMLFPCASAAVVAYSGATFGFPEVRRGALPGVVSAFAKRRISHVDCVRLMCTGDVLSVDEARTLGLVDVTVGCKEEAQRELARIEGCVSSRSRDDVARVVSWDAPSATPCLTAFKGGSIVMVESDFEVDPTLEALLAIPRLRVVIVNVSGGESKENYVNDDNARRFVDVLARQGVVTTVSIREHTVVVARMPHVLAAHYVIAHASCRFSASAAGHPEEDEWLSSLQMHEVGLVSECTGARCELGDSTSARVLQFAWWICAQPATGVACVLHLEGRVWEDAQRVRRNDAHAAARWRVVLYGGDGEAYDEDEEVEDDTACVEIANDDAGKDAWRDVLRAVEYDGDAEGEPQPLRFPVPPQKPRSGTPTAPHLPPSLVGIHALEMYTPPQFVTADDLEGAHGVVGKYTSGLEMCEFAACDDDEDAVSMALTATARLMAAYGISARDVGMIQVGSESLLDRSKSIKSNLMQLFTDVSDSGGANVEGTDSYHACYGGTSAFFSCAQWCDGSFWDGRWAIAVCTDISDATRRYPFLSGAACVSVLVGPHAPLVLERGRVSRCMHEFDFTKPVGWPSMAPLMDGPYSMEVYFRCLRACQSELSSTDASGVAWVDAHPRLVFHLGGSPKFVRHAFYQALDAAHGLSDADDESRAMRFDDVVRPSLSFARRIGMMHTAAAYTNLCSLLAHESLPQSSSIGVFSFGSGAMSTAYALRVCAGGGDAAVGIHPRVRAQLDARVRLSAHAFEEATSRFSESYGRFGWTPHVRHSPRARAPSDTYLLSNVDVMGRRSYQRLTPHTCIPVAIYEAPVDPGSVANPNCDAVPSSPSRATRSRRRTTRRESSCSSLDVDVVAVLHRVACDLLGDGDAVNMDTPLMDAGLDSLGATEFASRVARATSTDAASVPETLVFDHPSLRQVAVFLRHMQGERISVAHERPAYPEEKRKTRSVRVVGIIDDLLCAIASDLVDASDVNMDVPLMDAGLDSLGATEFASRVARATSTDAAFVPETLVFDYPSLRRISRFMQSICASSQASGDESSSCDEDESRCTDDDEAEMSRSIGALGAPPPLPIRVQSIDVRAPRCARTAPAFAAALSAASDCVQECVAEERWTRSGEWDVVGSAADTPRARHAGLVCGADSFDHARFSVPYSEASSADPQQRVLLEVAYAGVHHAGVARNNDAEVYVGVSILDFEFVLRSQTGAIGTSLVYHATGGGTGSSVLCGRISYALGFHGACATIDTACSSALSAMHIACTSARAAYMSSSLQLSSPLLCGGVNIMLTPHVAANFAAAGMTSPNGRSRTFDAGADGYARSEACVGAVLRASEDAGVEVTATAVRQDGRSASLTAPNGSAQRALVDAALHAAGLAPAEVAGAESHGTGTALGDPIEAGSLVACMAHERETPVGFFGCKANVGHAEPTAGMTGVSAIVMAQPRPNARLRVLNPHVRQTLRPMGNGAVLTTAAATLTADRICVEGVDSFGFAGTIAHALLSLPADGVVSSLVSAKTRLMFRRRRLGIAHLGRDVATAGVAVGIDDHVISVIAGISDTGHRPGLDESLTDGMDSLAITELQSALAELYDSLPFTLVFDAPTTRQLLCALSVYRARATFGGVDPSSCSSTSSLGADPVANKVTTLGILPGFDGSHFHFKALETYLRTLIPNGLNITRVQVHDGCRDTWLDLTTRAILQTTGRGDCSCEHSFEVGDGGDCGGTLLALLGYSAGATLLPVLMTYLWTHARCRVDALLVVDPGFMDGSAALSAFPDMGVRIIATSVLEDRDNVVLNDDTSPDAIDTVLARALMIEAFPTYTARFSSAECMQELLRELPVDNWKTDLYNVSVLLVVSSRAHNFLSNIAGGPRAEAEWTIVAPHAVVHRVGDVDHVGVPYSSETAFASGHFLCCLQRTSCDLALLRTARNEFESVVASMRAVQQEFRATYRRTHGNIDLRRRLNRTHDDDLCVRSRTAYARLHTKSTTEFWGTVARSHMYWYDAGSIAWLSMQRSASEDGDGDWHGWCVDEGATPVQHTLWSGESAPWSAVCDSEAAERDDVDWNEVRWFVGAQTNVGANELDLRILKDADGFAREAREESAAFMTESTGAHANESHVTPGALLTMCLGAMVTLRRVAPTITPLRAALHLQNDICAVAWIGALKRMGAPYTAIAAGASATTVMSRVEDLGASIVVVCVALKGVVGEALFGGNASSPAVVTADDEMALMMPADGFCARDIVRNAWERGDAPVPVDASHPLFVLYTSGSTGKPKGIVHVHAGYAVGLMATSRTVLDLGRRPANDTLLVVATPGWITGQSYMIAAALLTRTPSVLLEGSPVTPPDRFAAVVDRRRVTVLKAGSTFLRMLMMRPDAVALLRAHDTSTLRLGTFCAEPVNDAVHRFAMENLATQYINSYWATEHGGIVWSRCYGNSDQQLRPDTRTWPLPWLHGSVYARSDGGDIDQPDDTSAWRVAAPGESGEIVIRRPYPYLALTVWQKPDDSTPGVFHSARWRNYFTARMGYVQGDVAVRHEDGAYTFHGRSDEVINVGGNRIGTAEIESAILAQQTVAESTDGRCSLLNCVVVGVNDRVLGTVPWAFVVLRDSLKALSPHDEGAMRAAVRSRLGDVAIPQAFVVVTQLPETHSGKFVRALLRDLANAKDGDLPCVSTLKNPECVGDLRASVASVRATGTPPPPPTSGSRYVSTDLERRRVREHVEACVTALTGNATIPSSAPLMDQGMDSLGATHLASRLSEAIGVTLNATLVFECSTVDGIVAHVCQTLQGGDARMAKIGVANETSQPVQGVCALHLVQARLPAGFDAAGCMAGADALVGGIPAARRVLRNAADGFVPHSPEASRLAHGGFVSDVECFDAVRFALSSNEVAHMDPQQRMILEMGERALQAWSQPVLSFASRHCGVFVGIEIQDFERLSARRPFSVFSATGFTLSVASGRLSFTFDLHGPCVAYATACSASLVANHAACHSLESCECDSAVVAGVNLMLLPDVPCLIAKAGMTSVRGRCHTWDARADGYARSEACVATSIGYLDSDRADAECGVFGAARGGSVRSDGRSASLTAPNAHAQAHLLASALQRTGTSADEVLRCEFHGTGTALGDPIEASTYISTIDATRSPDSREPSWSGTKANVGHTEPAAGMTGTVLLILTHVCLWRTPPAAQLHVLNPHMTVRRAIRPTTQALPEWLSCEEIGAVSDALGISSFGYSGTIAHCIINAKRIERREHDDTPVALRRRKWCCFDYGADSVAACSESQLYAAPRIALDALGGTLVDAIRRSVVAVLDEGQDFAGDDAPLMDTGLDSLGTTELQSQLQDLIDEAGSTARIPATLIFDAPTVRTLHDVLKDVLPSATRHEAEAADQTMASAASRGTLVDAIRRSVIAVLDEGQDFAGDDAPLMDTGLDSLGTTELQSQLQDLVDEVGSTARLPATLIFDAPTVRALHDVLKDAVPSAAYHDATTACDETLCKSRLAPHAGGGERGSEAIVVNSAWRLPGGADSAGKGHRKASLHVLLQSGADVVTQVPSMRWSSNGTSTPSSVRHGALVSNIEQFDCVSFGMNPAEAWAIDPQQRLLLECGKAALGRDASIASRVAVFVGMEYYDYPAVLDTTPLRHSVYAANSGGMASGRLSFMMGLQGPCFLVGATCASGLVVCDLAKGYTTESIESSSSVAIAAAASIMLLPHGHRMHARAGSLSSRGRCHTFDSRADGFARGEAVIATSITAAGEALPCARLLAARTMCDGRSASFTAPNGAAQRQLLVSVANASAMSYFASYEAHGTGTRLGDPIETGSVAASRALNKAEATVVMMSAVKATMAHVEPAAGLAGLMSTCARKHGGTPNAHLRLLNAHVASTASTTPLAFSTTPACARGELTVLSQRVFGVSAFGINGTIAHVLVDMPHDVVYTGRDPIQWRRKSFPWFAKVSVPTKEKEEETGSSVVAAKESATNSNPRECGERVDPTLMPFSWVTPERRHMLLGADEWMQIATRTSRDESGSLVSLGLDDESDSACVTLNNPTRFNALSLRMSDDLRRVVAHLAQSPAVAIALCGRGSHFCVGGDPYASECPRDASLSMVAHVSQEGLRGFAELHALERPLIAAMHGFVVGGGIAVALLADRRIADPALRLEHGNLVRGVCPLGMFSRTLPHVVGRARAMRLYITNEQLDASQAQEWGIVHDVCDSASSAGHGAQLAAQEEATHWASRKSAMQRKVLLAKRLSLDEDWMAAEGVLHARCRQASGGSYARPSVARMADMPAVRTTDDIYDAECAGYGCPTRLNERWVRLVSSRTSKDLVEQVDEALRGKGDSRHVLSSECLRDGCEEDVRTRHNASTWLPAIVFSAGKDETDFCVSSNDECLERRLAYALTRGDRCGLRVVMCTGAASGAGLCFSSSSTYAVAHKDATFTLPRQCAVTTVFTDDMMVRSRSTTCHTLLHAFLCTGETITAEDARTMGLVQSVMEDGCDMLYDVQCLLRARESRLTPPPRLHKVISRGEIATCVTYLDVCENDLYNDEDAFVRKIEDCLCETSASPRRVLVFRYRHTALTTQARPEGSHADWEARFRALTEALACAGVLVVATVNAYDSTDRVASTRTHAMVTSAHYAIVHKSAVFEEGGGAPSRRQTASELLDGGMVAEVCDDDVGDADRRVTAWWLTHSGAALALVAQTGQAPLRTPREAWNALLV